MGFITSTHEAESVLLRLEALVSEHQPRPSTLAELRELVSDEKPTLKDALDTMASWGKKYYGMTPARLLKSRGILASGAARGAKSEKRKPTETELSLDDGEIKRILDDVREKYNHEVRPSGFRELTRDNPELARNLKQVKHYISKRGHGSTAKYFEEEEIISKCVTEDSLPRPDSSVIDHYHSEARMTKERLLELMPEARLIEFETISMVWEDDGDAGAYEMLRVGDYLDAVVEWFKDGRSEVDRLPYGRVHFHFCGHDLGIIRYQEQMDHQLTRYAGKPEEHNVVGGRVYVQTIGVAKGNRLPKVPVRVFYAIAPKGQKAPGKDEVTLASARDAVPEAVPKFPDVQRIYPETSEHRFSYVGQSGGNGFEYSFWLPSKDSGDDLQIASEYLASVHN